MSSGPINPIFSHLFCMISKVKVKIYQFNFLMLKQEKILKSTWDRFNTKSTN